MAVLAVITLLALVVINHEAGHALAASLMGIPYEEIHIGLPFPPEIDRTIFGKRIKLTPWRQKKIALGGKTIILQPWPFGGGVGIEEENLYKASWMKMALVLLAGPAANFLAGALVAIIMYGPSTAGLLVKEFSTAAGQSVGLVISGEIGLPKILGPVGMVAIMAEWIKIDPGQGIPFVWLLLSIVSGFINLFVPLPALDGGHLLIGTLIQLGGKRPKAIQASKDLNLGFFLFFFGLMIVLSIKDIVLLLQGGVYNLF